MPSNRPNLPILVLICFTLAACQPIVESTSTPTISPTPEIFLPSLPSATPLPGPTGTPVPSATPSPRPSPTPLPATPTITPTYAILRGRVLPDHANCRYGPGAAYLYKYGLVGGSNLEIIGRNESGTWVLIRAIGGTNPCWVNASLMEPTGNVLAVAPVDVHIILPWSPYYTPLTNVSARRDGDVVTVSWSPLPLRAGDDAEQVPYVLEAWVCQGGELVFVALGVYEPIAALRDQVGCAEPSHGRVLAAEKHGYTLPVEVVWP